MPCLAIERHLLVLFALPGTLSSIFIFEAGRDEFKAEQFAEAKSRARRQRYALYFLPVRIFGSLVKLALPAELIAHLVCACALFLEADQKGVPLVLRLQLLLLCKLVGAVCSIILVFERASGHH